MLCFVGFFCLVLFRFFFLFLGFFFLFVCLGFEAGVKSLSSFTFLQCRTRFFSWARQADLPAPVWEAGKYEVKTPGDLICMHSKAAMSSGA